MAAGFPLGFVARHAVPQVLLDPHLEVTLQFLVELCVEGAMPPQIHEATELRHRGRDLEC